ncbi:hypothetical protein CNYM01_00410 [Colletotrichum nymphaeae SA-01]|uniref:Phytanoyl-CoA dioxygenase n=1 Tax=Colletotrichum nymphaeae SA-01 TaxID=1460502 RepID=A0A135TVB9_9PEZI|nr:hypothetical protein CNYM01_00410 [Colletotrichum nymphaeae SA-01]
MAPYPRCIAKPGERFLYAPPSTPFQHLTDEEAKHFVEHGWLRVENAINPDIIQRWMKDLWVRCGYDAGDKSTWAQEYLHLPFHRQLRYEEFAPKAFDKITDIMGGVEAWDDERERWVGDNFVVNFGSESRSRESDNVKSPKQKGGWHCDNDWFRQFLDSSGTTLTVINCFTDIPPGGGGTLLCEDGLRDLMAIELLLTTYLTTEVCKRLYDHPEGLDPALTADDLTIGVRECEIFQTVEAKKGDVFILHGLVPHTANYNYHHYARVITNTHVTLKDQLHLDRPDKNYTLAEQVILRALDRESIPEFKPTRERKFWYPRNFCFKEKRIEDELKAMKEAAASEGLDASKVDSIWLSEKARSDFARTNGLLLPVHEEAGFETKQHSIQ